MRLLVMVIMMLCAIQDANACPRLRTVRCQCQCRRVTADELWVRTWAKNHSVKLTVSLSPASVSLEAPAGYAFENHILSLKTSEGREIRLGWNKISNTPPSGKLQDAFTKLRGTLEKTPLQKR